MPLSMKELRSNETIAEMNYKCIIHRSYVIGNVSFFPDRRKHKQQMNLAKEND